MTIKSNTPAHDKDCWQTPLWLFDALDIEFGFWLDSAASDKNALCAHWLTEADDALNSEWVSHGAIWNNPPYSNIRPWVEKAAEQCIQQRQTVVMLVPEDMSVGWAANNHEDVTWSSIAAGFKGLITSKVKSRPQCCDDDAMIICGCMARLKKNNSDLHDLLVDYYVVGMTFMSLAGKHCCSDGYIGKRLQKAEGIIEGMLMALDIRLEMDIVVNNSN
ncbi:phage N-6-adenine-methyltransferase [Escherichia coli]|nr:phage N-6-adenine-methyltransferase [Escherichia coli]